MGLFFWIYRTESNKVRLGLTYVCSGVTWYLDGINYLFTCSSRSKLILNRISWNKGRKYGINFLDI